MQAMCGSAPGLPDGIPIGINADGGVTAEATPPQCLVEQQAPGRVHWRDDSRSNQHDVDPELTKRFDQGAGSDIASASAPYVPWNSRYELKQAHGHPERAGR
jgi:hypothetical protein